IFIESLDVVTGDSFAGETAFFERTPKTLPQVYSFFTRDTAAVGAGTNAVATSAYIFDRSQAYLIAIKRDLTVENFDLPTYDMQGAAVTQRIDVKALRTNAISKITSS
ncbi:hypothetical protein LCGC14_1997320, partial [marine sediment metagenome]